VAGSRDVAPILQVGERLAAVLAAADGESRLAAEAGHQVNDRLLVVVDEERRGVRSNADAVYVPRPHSAQ
jgi:hypothetical protein